MILTISDIEKEAKKILQKIKSGELIDGCSMSAVQTPAMEAWEIATSLSEKNEIASNQRIEIISKLDKDVQSQLEATSYDDFDLAYEYLLQLIKQK
jgi:hypothetical protein